MDDREFWLAVRRALLMILDALECRLGIEPRTSQIRREAGRTRP
jgi:hypothetical protein